MSTFDFSVRTLINLSVPGILLGLLLDGTYAMADSYLIAALVFVSLYLFRRIQLWKLVGATILGIVLLITAYSFGGNYIILLSICVYGVLLVAYQCHFDKIGLNDADVPKKKLLAGVANYAVSLVLALAIVLLPDHNLTLIATFLLMTQWLWNFAYYLWDEQDVVVSEGS